MVAKLLPMFFRRLPMLDVAYRRSRAGQTAVCDKVPSDYRKLFIVGSPRSGTTWVNSIFSHHPKVISNGESHLYSDVMRLLRKGSCRDASTWKTILQNYDDRKVNDPRAGVHLFVTRGTFRRIIEEARSRAESDELWSDSDAGHFVIRSVLNRYYASQSQSRDDILVEKTPAHVLHGREILELFPEAQLLHVLRDGRDVCVSLEMRAKTVNWAPSDRHQQIKTWMRFVAKGLQLTDGDEFADRTMQIRYESIKEDPITAIGEMYDFARLDHDPDMLEEVAESTSFQKYRKTGSMMHNRKGIVGDWKNHFSEEDQQLFKETAGSLFEKCGYRFG